MLFRSVTKEVLEHMFNIPRDEAARFSLVLWGTVTLPLLLAGFAALMTSGSKLFELKRAAEDHANEIANNRPEATP